MTRTTRTHGNERHNILTSDAKEGTTISRYAPLRAGIPTERHRDSGAEDSKPGKTARDLPLSNGGVMPSSPDTPQEKQPDASRKPALVLQSRADLRDLLIKAGLARAAAEKVARGGWPALSGETTETDLAEDAAALARALAETLTEL
ncbi:hypothetical protein [Lacimonas salitolerans]|uniref:Uncharacterized protein n=1 Tax=Lacimonas salitolerans TaxID=1323750 RepID=A0ABW4E9Y4_9RHOB